MMMSEHGSMSEMTAVLTEGIFAFIKDFCYVNSIQITIIIKDMSH